MADYMDQLKIQPCEKQTVKIVGVDLLTASFDAFF